MRKGVGAGLGVFGALLYVLGWIVVLVLGIYLTYFAYTLAFEKHKVGSALALEFIGAPAIIALTQTVFGVAGVILLWLGERVKGSDSEGGMVIDVREPVDPSLDPITRRALAQDPELRDLWRRESGAGDQ
jgi:hypothetical protein